jgi:hypothetical protein
VYHLNSPRGLANALAGFLRFPDLLLPHQVRPSLGLDLDRDSRHLPRTPHLHPEQGAIDAQLEKGRQIASEQATQIKGLAEQHAGNAAKTVQGYTQQYTAKAQETINQYRGRSTSPEVKVKKEDFPAAPRHDLTSEVNDVPVTHPPQPAM